jgi:hypothetical protein
VLKRSEVFIAINLYFRLNCKVEISWGIGLRNLMVEVKFGICNNCVILKISTIVCARKTKTCFVVFLFV